MSTLISADRERCQCEIKEPYGAFRLGPPAKFERCKSKPTHIAKDGVHGEMSLCSNCAQELLRQPEIANRVTLTPISDDTTS